MGDSQDVTKGEIGSFFPYPELDPSDVAESKRKSPTWPPRSWSLLNSGRAALQQVLDMTSGTRFIEEYTAPDSDIGMMDYAAGWKPAPEGVDVTDWPTCIWGRAPCTLIGSQSGSPRHDSRPPGPVD